MVDELRDMVAEHERARTEIEKSRRQAEIALEELQAVQRRYVREQWERYPALSDGKKGYHRSDDGVGASEDAWLPTMTLAVQQKGIVAESDTEATLAIPIELDGEMIGVLGFSREESHAWGEEEIAIVQDIVHEVAEALDKQRLLDETQQALIETEELYQASAELAEAQTYDDVLSVLRARTLLGRADRSASLNLFDRILAGGESPEAVASVAQWTSTATAVGPRYLQDDSASALDLLHPDEPTIIKDANTDPRIDDSVRALYVGRYGVRSAAVVPLTVRGQWIGYVDAMFTEPTEFSEAEVRRLMVLAGQAAMVVQNLRQLEDTWARARRERILREITSRVRSLADPDTLAQAAVRELGSALGRPVFIRLGSAEELSKAAGSVGGGNGGKSVAGERGPGPEPVGHDRGIPGEGGE
jgi:GAF domain-containing protein